MPPLDHGLWETRLARLDKLAQALGLGGQAGVVGPADDAVGDRENPRSAWLDGRELLPQLAYAAGVAGRLPQFEYWPEVTMGRRWA